MNPWILDKIHSSWLVASWCSGLILGVILVAYISGDLFASWQWFAVGLVCLIPTLLKKQRWMVILMIISGFIIGSWRGGIEQVGSTAYRQLYGKQVLLMGTIAEDADVDKRGQAVIRLKDVFYQNYHLVGNVWVTTEENKVIKRGDRLTVKGELNEGFGSFVATMYRAEIEKIERPTPGDVAVGARDWFAGRVREHVPETEAALGLGYLLGLRRALPMELGEALQIAGLTHVIVASGYNLTILVRLSRRLFTRISKYLSLMFSSAMIIGFIAVTGMSSSMSRAGLVAGLSLLAWYYGRKIHPFVLIPLVAAITLLINPWFGWGDLGWQLSFMAFIGVIIVAPLLQRYFFGDKKPRAIRQIVGETIAAQIVTLPLLVLSFGVISNVAVLANMMILPLVPLAMLLTFLTGLLSTVPLLGDLLAWPTTWLLSYMVWVAEWLSGQPWAQTSIEISWWHVVITYSALAFAVWWMLRVTNYRLKDSNIVE